MKPKKIMQFQNLPFEKKNYHDTQDLERWGTNCRFYKHLKWYHDENVRFFPGLFIPTTMFMTKKR